MSDYGFATYDEKTGRIGDKINSKYPIFGPEYKNIATQYKTLKLSDSTTNQVRTASVAVPTDDECYWIGDDHYFGENSYMGYYDEMVASYKHNLNYRPLGYAVITGRLTRNQRYTLVQTQVSGMSMGGNFNMSGTITENITLGPKMGTMVSIGQNERTVGQDVSVMVNKLQYGGQSGKEIIIPDACDDAFVRPIEYHLLSDGTDMIDQCPFRVEITDTEVKVYRRIFWYDGIARAYQTAPSYARYNVNQRTKIIEDYAGSSLDVTIYLVPYNMEDLG